MSNPTPSQISDPRETRAAQWIESLGHRVRKIREDDAKKCDFDVSPSDGGDGIYAEVKTVEGPGQGEPLMWDSLFNTISNRIRDARKQFESVDPQHSRPRVLLFLSEDFRIHGQTIFDFFAGRIGIGGEIIRELKKFRLGRARGDLREIDLYVLLDPSDTPSLFFGDANQSHLARLQALFLSEH